MTLRRLSPQRMRHADIADLSTAGWRYVVGCPDLANASAGGEVLVASQIAAVLCRIDAVGPQDLGHLHVDDRSFAATEINAFLRAWLAQFRGRRCNEPSPASLAGPAWHPMYWRWLATRLEVPAVAASLATPDAIFADVDTHPVNARDAARKGEKVTALVVGDQVIGSADEALVRHSLRIARAVGSSLLALHFVWDRQWRFESADSSPQLDAHGAAKLLEWAMATHAGRSQDLRVAASAAAR